MVRTLKQRAVKCLQSNDCECGSKACEWAKNRDFYN